MVARTDIIAGTVMKKYQSMTQTNRGSTMSTLTAREKEEPTAQGAVGWVDLYQWEFTQLEQAEMLFGQWDFETITEEE
jgi:hypothetical protein